MRVVLQRVSCAAVRVEGQVAGAIEQGLLLLLGIEGVDTEEDADWLCRKVTQLRIFSDADGKMNLSNEEVGGGYLVISQFTLHAKTKKGTRPSFIRAARPEQAVPLYEYFIEQLAKTTGKDIATGVFGAEMQVELVNDGPVTILLDSQQKE